MTTSWCCQLCHVSRLWSRVRPDPELGLTRSPNLRNLDRFELRFGSIGPDVGRAGPGGVAVVHGRLWHAHLARCLAVSIDEVDVWCRDPAKLSPARSRAIAAATGLPLSLLRLQLDEVST